MRHRLGPLRLATVLWVALSLWSLPSPSLAAASGPREAVLAAAAELDPGETHPLVFMREEEKLARDVYLTLGERYPELTPFAMIDDSEHRHTDTMASQLLRYDVPDPSMDDRVGVFTGADYGGYFLEKFALLVGWGSSNRLDALYVGAFIEELDMHDIVHCPAVIVETDNGIGEDECGLSYTDEPSLIRSYGNLLGGSENHLRSFVRDIEKVTGQGTYVAQVLTQEEVDAILGR